MNKSIRQKLESTSDRFEEVSNLLADPEIIAQKKKFRDLSKEYARLNPIVSIFKEYQSLLSDIKTVDEMTKDNDHSIVEMGEEEWAIQQESLTRLNSILLDGTVQQSKVIGHQPYV